MKVLIATLLLAALAACGSAVQSANEAQVSIRYYNLFGSPDSARAMADAHCGSHDRFAVYERSSLAAGGGGLLTGLPVTAVFDCRTPIELSGIQAKPPEPSKRVEIKKAPPEPSKPVVVVTPKQPMRPMFAIHLSSLRDEVGAEKEWRELQTTFPDLLEGQELIVRSVELPEQGTFYRVMSGPIGSYAKAEDLCAEFEAKERYCRPVDLDEDRSE